LHDADITFLIFKISKVKGKKRKKKERGKGKRTSQKLKGLNFFLWLVSVK
jgi:hypothetical protein